MNESPGVRVGCSESHSGLLAELKLEPQGGGRVVVLLLSLQSCPTLCDPIDGNPSGSTVPGILQIRTLERVAISFSNA